MGGTLPDPLPSEPMEMFQAWLRDAIAANKQPNPTSMALATATPLGRSSVRIVLCRGVDAAGGYIVFFTNYDSRKGEELRANPHVSAVFHWDQLDRQIRLEGVVTKCPAEQSDAYFASRPLMSRVGAWTSKQSQPLASRSELFAKNAEVEKRFGIVGGDAAAAKMTEEQQKAIVVPRPENWGGYRFWIRSMEFWLGDSSRLHDRAVWTRPLVADRGSSGDGGYVGGAWTASRLQP